MIIVIIIIIVTKNQFPTVAIEMHSRLCFVNASI